MSFLSFMNEGNVFFRPPVLLTLIWFLWGINVWVFRKVRIDYTRALNFDPNSTLQPQTICISAIVMLGAVFVLWLFHRVQWPFEDPLVIPSSLYILSLFFLVIPLDILHRKGREKLLYNFLRVVVPSTTGVLFVEVVMGDMLTSLSKTLADLQVSLCILFTHSITEGSIIDPDSLHTGSNSLQAACSESLFRPVVTSLPFLLRFRQCILSYRLTGLMFPHLVNAAKYASALPVIWISAFAHHFPDHYGLFLRKVWLVAITFNSFFSFLWDVVMDFGLFRSETNYLFLRQKLYYMNDGTGKRMLRGTRSPSSGGIPPLKSKFSNGDIEVAQEEDEDVLDPILNPQDDDGAQRVEMITAAATKALSIGSGSTGEDMLSRRRNFAGNNGSSLSPIQTNLSSTETLHDQDAASLSLFTYSGHQPLLPKTPIIYYVGIVLDFLLRVLWSFKLSVNLHLTQEGLTFVLEVCEVLRRFLWLFFRIEWQCIELEDEEGSFIEEDMSVDGEDLDQYDENNFKPGETIVPVSSSGDQQISSGWMGGARTHPLRSRTPSDRTDITGSK